MLRASENRSLNRFSYSLWKSEIEERGFDHGGDFASLKLRFQSLASETRNILKREGKSDAVSRRN